MTKSRILVCSLVLLLAPDALPGQPSGALRARPEHLRAAAAMETPEPGTPLFRLTPFNSAYFEPSATPPTEVLGFLAFQDVFRVGAQDPNEALLTVGGRAYVRDAGFVTVVVGAIPPDQNHVLEFEVHADTGRSFVLYGVAGGYYSPGADPAAAPGKCIVNFQVGGTQSFSVSEGNHTLLAVVSRPADAEFCYFMLKSPNQTGVWTFFTAELSQALQF